MKIVPMLCGVSGSLQLLEPRKDIKSSGGINLPLFHCNALSVVPKICFCKTEQKPRHRSIFLVPTLKLNAAVYTRWQKNGWQPNSAPILLSMVGLGGETKKRNFALFNFRAEVSFALNCVGSDNQ